MSNSDEYRTKPLGWCNRCGCLFFKSELDEHEGYCIDCFTWRQKKSHRLLDELKEFFDMAIRPWLPFAPAMLGIFLLLDSILKG